MLTLHFYIEEPSMEVALLHLLPKILEGKRYDSRIFTFNGKPDLLRKLPQRLQAYRYHADPKTRAIIILDRDNDDCLLLKQRLETIAQNASLTTKTRPNSRGEFQVINRIAVEELEAWFLGDENAIRTAYPRVPSFEKRASYRDPDAMKNAAEQLEKLLRPHYHKGGLAKKRAAHDIAQKMNPATNRSRSFQVFRDALLGLFE